MKSREKVMKNSLKFVEKVFCNMTCREKLVKTRENSRKLAKTRQKSPKVAKSRQKSPKVVKTGQKSKFRIWRNLLYNKFQDESDLRNLAKLDGNVGNTGNGKLRAGTTVSETLVHRFEKYR